MELRQRKFASVHAPVGLDIGALYTRRNCHQHYGGAHRHPPRRHKSLPQGRESRKRHTRIGGVRGLFCLPPSYSPPALSSRMGRPKALLPTAKEHFSKHLIQVTRHSRIGVTRVVLGAGAKRFARSRKLDTSLVVVEFLVGSRANCSSICAGDTKPGGHRNRGDRFCVRFDHPLVSARLVSDLVAQFYLKCQSHRLPVHNGRRGHPVDFLQVRCTENARCSRRKGARAWSGRTRLTSWRSQRTNRRRASI